ncbi:MAG: hypothetical protein R3C68_16100 [Myxococcota bacterium]
MTIVLWQKEPAKELSESVLWAFMMRCIDWALEQLQFRVQQEIFVNDVLVSAPVLDVSTNNSLMPEWFERAGGAHFCRASRSTDIRPGHTAWAVKPLDDNHTDCGCSGFGWRGRGSYYGGFEDSTVREPAGGGWAPARGNGIVKGGVTSSDVSQGTSNRVVLTTHHGDTRCRLRCLLTYLRVRSAGSSPPPRLACVSLATTRFKTSS